jgi:threonine dehydratase
MVDLAAIQAARTRIDGLIKRTPLLYSDSFSHLFGAPIYLKAENLQRTGSFKIRGASNKIAQLTPEQAARGVITSSAGNHAQGVALAASLRGVACTVVMPETASLAKYEATVGYGATVELSGANFEGALARAQQLARERGLVFIPAFDDEDVVAGQGTVGLEILEDLPDAGLVIVPVGGGGLCAGIATAVKALRPGVRIVGVQSASAPSAFDSFHSDHVVPRPPTPTIADGIAVGKAGEIPVDLLRKYLDDLVVVDDESIAHAIVLLMERSKMLVEPAGAVGVAALLAGVIKTEGAKTAIVLSGGNLDIALLARIVEHGLSFASRYLMIRATLEDRPGELARLLGYIAELKANVVDVEHHRTGLPLGVEQAEVQLTLEVHNREHAEEVMQRLHDERYLR